MSWWMRSSPMEFSRMTPRAKMIAGLAGMGMGNLGIESRTAASGALLSLRTVQSVAVPQYVPSIVAAQPMMALPRGVRGGLGRISTIAPTAPPSLSPAAQLPSAPTVTAEPLPTFMTVTQTAPIVQQSLTPLAPAALPELPRGQVLMPTGTSSATPETREQTKQSQNRYAEGTRHETAPELMEDEGGENTFYPSEASPPTPGTVSKKPHTLPSGVISLKAEAAAANKLFGFPRWAVIAGGIGLGLIVLYKVTK